MDQTTTPPDVEATSRTTDSAIAIAGIAVLIVSYAVNAMDRTLFPLMLTDVRREYGFSLPQAGLMSTIFTLGMTLAGIPTGYLMSRYSRKTVIQVGILIYSAATVITPSSRSSRTLTWPSATSVARTSRRRHAARSPSISRKEARAARVSAAYSSSSVSVSASVSS